jgi:hypothetical protein
MMSPPRGSTWSCSRQIASLKAATVFLAPNYLGDEGADVRAGDISEEDEQRLPVCACNAA